MSLGLGVGLGLHNGKTGGGTPTPPPVQLDPVNTVNTGENAGGLIVNWSNPPFIPIGIQLHTMTPQDDTVNVGSATDKQLNLGPGSYTGEIVNLGDGIMYLTSGSVPYVGFVN